MFADVVTWSGEAQSINANTSLEALHITAATTVTIADGCSLTVDELVGDAQLTKAGGGTLIVKGFSANSQISATAGAVRFASGAPTDTTVFDSANTFFHTDASAAASLTLADDGTTVATWADIRGAGYPTASATGNKPYLRPAALNGRAVIDFGSKAISGNGFTDGYGATLDWSAVDSSIREVYLVFADFGPMCNQFFLGNKKTGGEYSYHRGGFADSSTCAQFFNTTYAWAAVRGGGIYMDGNVATAATELPSGFHVLRFVQTGVTTASAFANDRNITRGGAMMAEAIVMNANLDAVSSRLLEMRLQQKWLPDTRSIANLSLSSGATLTVDEGVKIRVVASTLDANATITGAGEAAFCFSEGCYSYPAKSIIKTTESQRAIYNTAARRIRVESGLLQIKSTLEKLAPTVHLDATQSDSFTLVSGNKIQYWNDVRGYNVAQARQYTDVQRPYLEANVQNGLSVVDFGDLYLSGHWAEANAPRNMAMASEVSNIKDVFIVVADTDDARQYCSANNETCQFLLCHSTAYDFHRAGFQILRDTYGCGKDAGTTTQLDGITCDKYANLPEGFHLVRISPQNAVKFNQLCKERSGNRYGGLKYGEILVYNAKLSDTEAAALSAHLLNKWGLPNASGNKFVYDEVYVASGAIFTPPRLASAAVLEGAGTVRNDFALADGFALNVTAGKPLTVTGKLTIPATGIITIAGSVKDFEKGAVVQLVAADSMVAPSSPTWTVQGTFTECNRNIRVFADATGLSARIIEPGLSVIIR